MDRGVRKGCPIARGQVAAWAINFGQPRLAGKRFVKGGRCTMHHVWREELRFSGRASTERRRRPRWVGGSGLLVEAEDIYPCRSAGAGTLIETGAKIYPCRSAGAGWKRALKSIHARMFYGFGVPYLPTPSIPTRPRALRVHLDP